VVCQTWFDRQIFLRGGLRPSTPPSLRGKRSSSPRDAASL
jgi:hypothetical protein